MKLLYIAGLLPCLASAFVPSALKVGTSSVALKPNFTPNTVFTDKINNRNKWLLKAIEDGDLNGDGMNGTAEKKKVIVLGGDGFCGWPTSLYLSDQGHDIVIVDNLSRRNIDTELGCDSLTPIQSPEVSFE